MTNAWAQTRLLTLLLLTFFLSLSAQEWDTYDEYNEEPEWGCFENQYITGTIGFSFFAENDGRGPGLSSSVETETGYITALAWGYTLNACWAAELEVSRRAADIENASVNGIGFSASGHHRIWALMFNVMYDLGTDWGCVQPYVGAGIGIAHQLLRVQGTGTTDIDDSQNGFAFQTISGLAYPVSECLEVCLEHRYFLTSDPRFRNRAGTGVVHELATQSLALNARWYF